MHKFGRKVQEKSVAVKGQVFSKSQGSRAIFHLDQV